MLIYSFCWWDYYRVDEESIDDQYILIFSFSDAEGFIYKVWNRIPYKVEFFKYDSLYVLPLLNSN